MPGANDLKFEWITVNILPHVQYPGKKVTEQVCSTLLLVGSFIRETKKKNKKKKNIVNDSSSPVQGWRNEGTEAQREGWRENGDY